MLNWWLLQMQWPKTNQHLGDILWSMTGFITWVLSVHLVKPEGFGVTLFIDPDSTWGEFNTNFFQNHSHLFVMGCLSSKKLCLEPPPPVWRLGVNHHNSRRRTGIGNVGARSRVQGWRTGEWDRRPSPGQGEGLLGSCPVISPLPCVCPLASVGAAANSARGPHPALRTQFS